MRDGLGRGRVWALLGVLAVLAVSVGAALPDAPADPCPPACSDDWRERLGRTIPAPEEVQVARSSMGVAATLNPEATRAALEVLEAGGNAMDAAAAAWLVLTVVSPNQTGLGAGGYILYHDADSGHSYFVDANVRAGMAAHPEVFLDEDGVPLSSAAIRERGMAVGVPGMVRGFDVALKRWGTRYFDTLADHAIQLAEGGWEVDRELALRIHETHESLGPQARSVYLRDGRPLEPGDTLIQRDKARTLRLLAEHGSHAFYQGEVAEATARFVQELGGFLTVDDFRRYNVSVDPPLRFPYREYEVATNPNVSGGATLATLLGILEPFELDLMEPRSATRYHLLLEAGRLAAAGAVQYFADPEQVDRPWQGLLSREFLESRRSQILPNRRNLEIRATDPWSFQPGGPYRTQGHHPPAAEAVEGEGDADWEATPLDEGTDHFTIVDREGNVVAVTSTLGVAWTAGHMVPGYGFMLNVTGGYFDREPGGAHEISPGKRPRSDMTPTIVYREGEPWMTVGSPSPSGMQHVQVLLNVLEHGMDPARAIADPRVAPVSVWEEGVPREVLDELRGMGHPMAQEWTDQGAVSILLRDGDAWMGAADPRRDGLAMGVEEVRDPPGH